MRKRILRGHLRLSLSPCLTVVEKKNQSIGSATKRADIPIIYIHDGFKEGTQRASLRNRRNSALMPLALEHRISLTTA